MQIDSAARICPDLEIQATKNMPAHPTENPNRLAELETAVAALQQELIAKFRRLRVGVHPRQVRQAITKESTSVYDPYPRAVACELPIKFIDEAPDDPYDGTWCATFERSGEPRTMALSPIGWLPPNVLVDVQWDGSRWVLVRWPVLLHGIASVDIAGGTWEGVESNACDGFVPGEGEMQVCLRTAPSLKYLRQVYANGDPVLMPVFTTSDIAVVAGKILTAAPESQARWFIIDEPCGGVCTV